jgi:hypothetical protein
VAGGSARCDVFMAAPSTRGVRPCSPSAS